MKPIYPMLAAVLILPIGALAEEDKTVPELSPKLPADNSGKNGRDRDNKTLTAGDQSERPEDLKLTRAIRQAIMKDKIMSITAKNIKIITASGRVTLRGPVNNADEKAKIHNLAKTAAGQVPVDNQLEVKVSK